MTSAATMGGMGEWRTDFGNAPKDGTPVLGHGQRFSIGLRPMHSCVIQWNVYDERWRTIPNQYSFHPTHWMPLPPDPTP